MPCPPDPMESSFSKGNDELDEIEIKFNRLSDEVNQTRAVIKRLQSSNNLSEETQKILADIASVFSAGKKLQDFSQNTYFNMNDFGKVLSDLYSTINHNENKLKQKENELCVLRHALLKVPVALDLLNEELKSDLQKERELHLIHRRDDRNAWLNWLKEREKASKHSLDDKAYKGKEAEIKSLIDKINEEINRVEALSESEILDNRNIFGRNKEDFDLPQ